MKASQELEQWLADWPAASAEVEHALTDECLTGTEVSLFVDNGLPAEERERAATHLARCSYCTRQVGSLLRASRDLEDRLRARRALGGLRERVGACVRVFIDEARGAFTRFDGLLNGFGPAATLTPAWATTGLRTRSLGLLDAPEETDDRDAVHEATLVGEGLPNVDLCCCAEDGSVTVCMDAAWGVALIGPDGSMEEVPLEPGEDGNYYAFMTAMPPGEYFLTLLRPEHPNHP
jgi:hypothetical protein